MTGAVFVDLFVPAGIAPWLAGLVVLANFAAAAFSAAVGLGGGIAILAILANLIPAGAVIPIHACIQFGSNSSRAFIIRDHIAWSIALWFILGALAGAVAGSRLAIDIPTNVLQVILGGFVLVALFAPKPRSFSPGKAGLAVGGAIATVATFFVGATGMLVAAVLPSQRMTRHEVVSTHAFLMSVKHLLKIVFFGLAGFAYGPWLGFLAIVIAAGFAGTYAGTLLLGRISERWFKIVFRGFLALLALRLLYTGLNGLWTA